MIPVITIDGPTGVGKSTLCKLVSKIFRWKILDSGAIYRVLALKALYYHIDLTSEEALTPLARQLNIHFMYTNNDLKVIFNNQDVSKELHIQKVVNAASQIALFPRVREALLYCQREFREAPGLIANGRDMGTVVFPDAIVKIFLDASLEERANRRMLQLQKHGFDVNFDNILLEIEKRDDCDRKRNISPLIPDKDALIINSTRLNIDQTIKKILKFVHKKLYDI